MGKQQLLIAMLVVAITTTIVAVVVDAAAGDIATLEFFNGIINQARSDCAGRNDFYTHHRFMLAVQQAYPSFGNLGSDQDSKREVAAFFAHVTHETGSMCHVRERERPVLCDPGKGKCADGRSYYGRGPLQLSWNYNYIACGQALGFDGLNDPDIVARLPVLTWKASLWFWMTNVRPVLSQGFGATIRRINSKECDGGNSPTVQSRVQNYNAYCKMFGIPTEANPGC
ncbi:Endochitinase EP3 [Linum grandiflorum]